MTTVQVSSHVKFEFYVKDVRYDGTLYANLSDKTIHNAQFIKDKKHRRSTRLHDFCSWYTSDLVLGILGRIDGSCGWSFLCS